MSSVRRGRRRLAGAALAVTLCLVLFGCGRTPPEGFWEPTTGDTNGIRTAIAANKGYFRTGLAELAMLTCDSALPGTTAAILRKELVGNPFKQRFRLNALEHWLDTSKYDLAYKFIAGVNLDSLMRVLPSGETTWVLPNSETTCTVTFAETIPGTLRMRACSMTVWLRDSVIIIPPAETLRLPFYSSGMSPADTILEKPIAGAAGDGCVLRKEDGEWKLWKMAGGGRFYAPGPEDAPYILSFIVKSASRTDTIPLRPDTLRFGVQRFYSLAPEENQLLTFSIGDWALVTKVTTNKPDAYDYLYFNGRRYELKDTVKFDSTISPGVYKLSLEHIPVQVLWEVKGKYTATTWGIPIRIVGGAQ